MAACDAPLYAALGVEKWEEHGSCAENLVLALKELNQSAGLKGSKSIGADMTVNMAPTPLHLFMRTELNASGGDGYGLQVEEPLGKKRTHVKLRAERDVVVVMSACPMDLGRQNGGKCMAANFVVEVGERKGQRTETQSDAEATGLKAQNKKPEQESEQTDKKEKGDAAKNVPKPGKNRPKKLERRSTPRKLERRSTSSSQVAKA